MSCFSVEKTIREDGSQSVVLVDDNYQIVEEVALFLNYLEKRGMDKYEEDVERNKNIAG